MCDINELINREKTRREFPEWDLCDAEDCLSLVTYDGMNMEFVEIQTPEICRQAVINDSEAIRFVRDLSMLEDDVIHFRFHREGLKESMETVTRVKDIDDLVMKINMAYLPEPRITKGRLRISSYCYDKRIDWNTHIVVVNGLGVVGFLDGQF